MPSETVVTFLADCLKLSRPLVESRGAVIILAVDGDGKLHLSATHNCNPTVIPALLVRAGQILSEVPPEQLQILHSDGSVDGFELRGGQQVGRCNCQVCIAARSELARETN